MARKGENIRKRKDGRYEGRYITRHDENGKAKYAYVYGHSMAEVRERLKAAKGENAGEDFLTNRKFSEVADLWLNHDDKSIAQTTRDRYENTLELYILSYISDIVCRDVSDVEVNRLLKKVSVDCEGRGKGGGNLKSKTLVMIRNLVNQVLSYAKDMDFPEEKCKSSFYFTLYSIILVKLKQTAD